MSRPVAPIDVEAYRAQTDRLLKLFDFCARVGPSFGETTGPRDEGRELADEVTPVALLSARNAALQSAYEAVGRIARSS